MGCNMGCKMDVPKGNNLWILRPYNSQHVAKVCKESPLLPHMPRGKRDEAGWLGFLGGWVLYTDGGRG